MDKEKLAANNDMRPSGYENHIYISYRIKKYSLQINTSASGFITNRSSSATVSFLVNNLIIWMHKCLEM